MTNKSRNGSVLALAFIASLLAACGAEQKPTEPPPVKDTAFGDMVRCRSTRREPSRDSFRNSKEAMDRALEQNENPTARVTRPNYDG